MDLAAEMGVEVLTEAQYLELQKLGEFDTKRSSWLQTPPEIRSLGGAIYGDRRFGRVSSITMARSPIIRAEDFGVR